MKYGYVVSCKGKIIIGFKYIEDALEYIAINQQYYNYELKYQKIVVIGD